MSVKGFISGIIGRVLGMVLAAIVGWAAPAVHAAELSYRGFESGPVRPLVISSDGGRLIAVNTPNGTLEVFTVTATGLQLKATVPVGLEPVAVALRNDTEAWVVNHLSDSVSVVSLEGVPRVIRTLLVGDEPRDIVFAGSPLRAFVTTAHRGQQRMDSALAKVPGAGDPKLTQPGIPRADVWVFDALNLGNSAGGVPLRIVSFFADTPRALAVSPDRATVYVAAFKSGNQTTTLLEELVCNGFDKAKSCKIGNVTAPGGVPGPAVNFEGKPAPEVGLMVKFNRSSGKWEDGLKRDWSSVVRFRLPDLDVFALDAVSLKQTAAYAHVGTTLFNMAVNPKSGTLYVTNTEANNFDRFEGPGIFAGRTLQGKLAQSRITVIKNGKVVPRHLNKHIDYSSLVTSTSFDKTARNHSLSTPLDMAVSADGSRVYVAAFGSSRIGVFDSAQLEDGSFDPRSASAQYITVSGGGPAGLALDEARGRLYVTTRFDNAVKVIDLVSRKEIAAATMPNPEPEAIVKGRPFLYDALLSSANGESSCASCHIFGDTDDLAWDLGNPDDRVTKSPIHGKLTAPSNIAIGKFLFGLNSKINGSDDSRDFHPMKGPMVTQTLRGMRNSGAMHWRGDRSTGIFGDSATDSTLSFKNFAVAFEGLLGNAQAMSEAGMNAFADFQLQVMLPPNPIRALDNSLNASQKRGSDFYFGARKSDGLDLKLFSRISSTPTSFNCNGCHQVNPAAGQFGTDGDQSFEGITQIIKIPQLRNMYQKVGMFGSAAIPFFTAPDSGFMGDQIRGFGFVHDGSVDTLFRFFTAQVFRPGLNEGFPLWDPDRTRRDVVEYMMAFDNDVAPIVGQQVTLHAGNSATAGRRIDLMIRRASTSFVSKELGGTTTECELVAHWAEGGERRAAVYDAPLRQFKLGDGTRRSDASLRSVAVVAGQEVSYTCSVPGSGSRLSKR